MSFPGRFPAGSVTHNVLLKLKGGAENALVDHTDGEAATADFPPDQSKATEDMANPFQVDDAGALKTSAKYKQLVNAVHEFPKRMPDHVLAASVGQTFMTARNGGFAIGLVVVLKSKDDLPKYRTHPVHKEFLENFGAEFEQLQALDWVN